MSPATAQDIQRALRDTPQGVRLVLRVTPRAARDEWCGMHGDALRIRLRAPPADQKANRALVEFLAEALEVPRSQILIERGATDRNKHVLIMGRAAAGISARLAAQMGS